MSTTHLVIIKGHAYHPAVLLISVGDCVQWKNEDSVNHTATRDQPPAFNTGYLEKGETSEPVCFDKPGDYEYYCIPHPDMKGKIVVKP